MAPQKLCPGTKLFVSVPHRIPPWVLFISGHKFRFTSRRYIISHRERCADHQPAPGAEGHLAGLGTLHMHPLQRQSDHGARPYRRWWVARYAKRFALPNYECCMCKGEGAWGGGSYYTLQEKIVAKEWNNSFNLAIKYRNIWVKNK